jgi:hypothetical protein
MPPHRNALSMNLWNCAMLRMRLDRGNLPRTAQQPFKIPESAYKPTRRGQQWT